MSMIGKSLIHYEITAEIGKGGMGEVYQAKDTKLGRDVAIKELPEEFALDKDRVSRFQREAKLLASLNHPNIAAIHGLEESEGIHFLVMELIEGDTLKDRIKSGPIPVEEALKLALQMAEALEAAHEKGVIHRDLKPANIKVTPDGKVKILDFGLAKAYTGDQENLDPADSPTLSAAATQKGVILGTAAYMSPEQAKGKSVDKRADIWAFGVVLFEMLTGRQLFTGETASETLASVMKSEPEWDSLPPNLHSRIRLLLERCLKKDPKNRYSGINDARVDIQEVLADPSGVFIQPVTTVESRSQTRRMLLWAAITVILVFVLGIIVWNLGNQEPPRVMKIEYVLPEDHQLHLNQLQRAFLDVSPDGNQIVYSTTKGLYLRSVDRLDTRHIPGSDDVSESPFFSPDGKWIGYFSPKDQKLKKIAIDGGVPIDLCNLGSSVVGAQWCPDSTIVFGLAGTGIKKILDSGGTPEPLFETESIEAFEYLIYPHVLPDREHVLFTKFINNQNVQIIIQSLENGEREILFSGADARYSPTGHIIYFESDFISLSARPFDLDRLEVTGGPIPIVKGVIGAALSEPSTLAFVPQPEPVSKPDIQPSSDPTTQGRTLWWVDRDGNEERIPAPPDTYKYPRISPDGTKVALMVATSGNSDVWIYNLVREDRIRLTRNEGLDGQPIWTKDGKSIIYYSMREDQEGRIGLGIYRRAANGTGEIESLCFEPFWLFAPWSLSHDETALVITRGSLNPPVTDIEFLSLEEEHNLTPLLHGEYVETQPQVSPDGRWIAYFSDESGDWDIYVRPFPEVDKDKFKVSTGGGDNPRWSPDSSELFYFIRHSDEEISLMAVSVKTEPVFSIGKPKELFRGNFVSGYAESISYDIDPNGERFLMIKPQKSTGEESAANDPRRINIVLNWFEELKQRVSVD